MIKLSFEGKVAVVLGAARGLGKEVAKQFAEGGARIFIADILEDKVQETCKEFRDAGFKCDYGVIDVANYKSNEELFKKVVKDTKALDIMVNCAGIVGTTPFLEATVEEIERLIDINVLGTNHSNSACMKEMIPLGKGGKICNYASFVGLRAQRGGFPHYGMSKGSVIYLTQVAAIAGAKYNINVNTIAPGIIRTEMWERILDFLVDDPKHGSHIDRDKQFKEACAGFIPMARGPQTEADIAYGTMFLCSSPYADQITGQMLGIDGGAGL